MSANDIAIHNMRTMMRPTTDASTQAVVVATLARVGPASVAVLAHASGESEFAVRRALRVLESAGLASRQKSHGPWSLVGNAPVVPATRPETHERDQDLARVAIDADLASTGKKPLPWWHGNPRTRSWWERKRMKDKELRAK